jgi:hypothetical protein
LEWCLSTAEPRASIAVATVHYAKRWPSLAEHLAQIISQLDRLLVRREVTAVRMLADEDDVVVCVDGPRQVR